MQISLSNAVTFGSIRSMEHVGAVIRALRERKGWTQNKLAQVADVSFSLVQKAEASPRRITGRPKFAKIAEALGMKPEELDPDWLKLDDEVDPLDMIRRMLARGDITSGNLIDIAREAANASEASRKGMSRKERKE